MKFNKDTILPLFLIMGVTIFFHWRQSAAQKQIDQIAADMEGLKNSVEEVVFVMKNDLKVLKTATANLKNMKDSKVDLDQEELAELKKKVEAMTLQNKVEPATTMLCEGGQDGVLKLHKSGGFEFFLTASVSKANPSGKGKYTFSGPFFVYSGILKGENGKQEKISGRALVTQQKGTTVSGIILDSAHYRTSQCNDGVVQKFK